VPTPVTEPDLAPEVTYTARDVPPPASRGGSRTQPKDFRRRQARPLDSRHPAYYLEQSATDRHFILAGSVIGAKHDQAGTRREDAAAFLAQPAAGGMVIAAVADGVSGARLSHLASTAAVHHSVDHLAHWLKHSPESSVLHSWEDAANELVTQVAMELEEERLTAYQGIAGEGWREASAGEGRRGRPSATLAVLVVDETRRGSLAWWLTVGDCDVVIVDFLAGDVNWLTRKAYREGPYTRALPSQRQVTHCGGPVPVADGQAVLALTDGMAELLDADATSASDALAAASEGCSALGDLLAALDARLQGNHDDRSLVAVGPVRSARKA
jgi:hypothetical protein